MQEVKYRAWDSVEQKMIYDFQFIKSGDGENDWIIPIKIEEGWEEKLKNIESLSCPRQRFKIMEYTGLELEEQKVYKYDIIEISAEDEDHNIIGHKICIVDFDRCSYVFAPSLKHRGLTMDNLFGRYKARYLCWKLLGNIFEDIDKLGNPDNIQDTSECLLKI